MTPEFSPQIFEKSPNIKLLENQSSKIQVVPCGQTETERRADGQTDMKKLIIAFRNFANAPTK